MNVLILGLGSIGKKHVFALRQLDVPMNIYALRSSKSSQPFDGVTDIYSLDEIGPLNISFAIIATPTSEHKVSILSLIEYNIPLFIEKPLYHKLELDELIVKIKEKNILTYVACNLRFLDSLVYLKKEIINKCGRINEVNVYCGSYLPEWRDGDFRNHYSANVRLGGGVHIDLIHELDYVYWFFGAPKRKQSYFSNNSSLGIEAVDYANYCLDYETFCASIILNYYRRDKKRTLELVCEDGTYDVNLLENKVFNNGKIIYGSDQSINDTYIAQMQYFLSLIRNNEYTSFNDIDDAYNVLKICL